MAKGIIVVDMPKSCERCRFSHNRIGINHYCYINESTGNNDAFSHPISTGQYYSKPDWCPIKKIPERLEELKQPHSINDYQRKGFSKGFNTCIDEIEGSAEK